MIFGSLNFLTAKTATKENTPHLSPREIGAAMDMHVIVKSGIIKAFEGISDEEALIERFSTPFDETYYTHMDQITKEKALQRYYTCISSALVLRDENINLSTSKAEELRIDLSKTYNVEIKPILDTENTEIKSNVAYCLFLLNGPALEELDSLLAKNKHVLELFNLPSSHDKRAIKSLINIMQFLAFSELEMISKEINIDNNFIESLSKGLMTGDYTNTQVANEINSLFIKN